LLFCTIRRVIPVKEVMVGILTGKVFRKRVDDPSDSTWCIGTMETGEKGTIPDDPTLIEDDYFSHRQPRFEIVTPPQTTCRGAQTVPMPKTEADSPIDSPDTIPKTRTTPGKPLPSGPSVYDDDGEWSGRGASFSYQNSLKDLPPVLQGPKSAPLPPVTEDRVLPPPQYRQDTSHHRHSVSGSSRTSSHTGSLGSVVSGAPLLGGHPPERK